VSLSNKKTQRFIPNLRVLIDSIFNKPEDEAQRDMWKDMIESYCMAMEILRKRNEYQDEDINQFQDLIDDFFEKYVSLTGCEGITNYFFLRDSKRNLKSTLPNTSGFQPSVLFWNYSWPQN
jgi:hypothetical protein